MQTTSCRYWVSYHYSGKEYHQSLHDLQFSNQLLWTWEQNPDPTNQLIHSIFYGPSLVRSQGLVMHHLILTFIKMLLSARAYHRWTEGSFSTRVLQPRLDLISNINRINVSCNQCFCFSAKEETLDMIAIPLSANISSSWSKFLKSEVLESEDKWFCPSCNCLTESSKETSIISLHST